MTKLGGRYLFRANRFTPSLNNHQAFDLPKEKKKIFSNTYLRKKRSHSEIYRNFSLFLSCTDFTKKKKLHGEIVLSYPQPA